MELQGFLSKLIRFSVHIAVTYPGKNINVMKWPGNLLTKCFFGVNICEVIIATKLSVFRSF